MTCTWTLDHFHPLVSGIPTHGTGVHRDARSELWNISDRCVQEQSVLSFLTLSSISDQQEHCEAFCSTLKMNLVYTVSNVYIWQTCEGIFSIHITSDVKTWPRPVVQEGDILMGADPRAPGRSQTQKAGVSSKRTEK
jgi:hypothetical protein